MGAHYETKEDLPNSCEEWCLSPDTCVYSLCCPCIASGIMGNAVSHDEVYCKACCTYAFCLLGTPIAANTYHACVVSQNLRDANGMKNNSCYASLCHNMCSPCEKSRELHFVWAQEAECGKVGIPAGPARQRMCADI